MRLIIMFLFISYTANSQSNYYVKVGGSDAANGLTDGTAWATVAKVNSTATNGDSVFFKRGDTWNEKLIPSANKIYYGAYGSGNKPELNAFVPVTGWTDSSSIWSASIPTSVAKLNTVLINGSLAPMCRNPNIGYFQPKSSGSNSYRIVTLLSVTSSGGGGPANGAYDTTDYTGAEAAVRTTLWIIDRKKIISRVGDTLNFGDSLSKPGFQFGGNGFILQNHISFLNMPGRYYFDSTNKIIKFYSLDTPVAKISTKDTLVFISKKDSVTIDNIKFTGANVVGIQVDTSRHLTITNCEFKNIGGSGVILLKSSHLTFKYNNIDSVLDNGITAWPANTPYTYIPTSPLDRLSDSCVYDSNRINKVGYIQAMGQSGNVHYNGLMSIGNDCVITNNAITNVGYSSLYFSGLRTDVSYNYVDTFCFWKDDGAGIQSGLGGTVPNHGSIVRKNIVLNGIGTGLGARSGTSGSAAAASIYIDDLNTNTTVDSCVTNSAWVNSILMHNNDSITITGNLAVNSSIGNAMALIWSTPNVMNGFVIKNNIFCTTDSTSYPMYQDNGITRSVGTLDSNHYLRLLKPDNSFYHNGGEYNLAEWQTETLGDDPNSTASIPINVITTKLPLFIYNATKADSTVVLPQGRWIDAFGTIYIDSVELDAFEGKLLFKASPVYPPGMRRYGNLIFK